MQFKAKELAHLLNGDLEGDGDVIIRSVGKIENAIPGDITFLGNPKYEDYIYNSQASAIIVNKGFQPQKPVTPTLIYVDNAYTALATLLQEVEKIINKDKPQGRETPNYIHETAQVAEDVYIGAFVYIGANAIVKSGTRIYPHTYIAENVKIGMNTTIFAGVKIYNRCEIANNCIIHSGAVIGGDGFGFAPKDGIYDKVPQLGNVVIHEGVEIGSNTTIDRATMGSTIIHSGVKLDNLIQIAHNVEIGENTVIAAQSGVAGSTKIGKNCMIGGQVGIVGHLNIADGTKIAAQSGISRSTQKDDVLFGSPAIEYKQAMKSVAVWQKLPELKRSVDLIIKNMESQ